MTVYIVERSLPGLGEQHRALLQEALTEASRRLSASGGPVRYLGSTLVPRRARWFCLFEAANEEVVKAVNEAALAPYVTINEAIELPAPRRSTARRRRERVAVLHADQVEDARLAAFPSQHGQEEETHKRGQ